MAGIFDVFTILFKSETEEATEGVKKLDGAVDQLDSSVAEADKGMTDLGQAAEEASSSQQSFISMASSVAGLAAAWVSLAGIVTNFNAAVGMADQLDEFTASIDGNIEELSAWGDAVKMNGGDMASFQGTIASLSADFTNLAVKGKSRVKPFFDELGISMLDANGKARNVMDVLPEIAEAFEGLSKQESLALGKKMGLDAATVRTLQGGKKELEDLLKRQKELGVITAEQAALSAEFNDALVDTAHAFRSIYLALAVDILPIFTAVMETIQNLTIFFREHSDAVVGFFGAIAAVIAGVYLPVIFTAIAATGLLSAPFLLIIAAVAALAAGIGLLYEDFKVFMEGGDSLLGKFLDRFDTLYGNAKTFRENMVEFFDDITKAIKGMWYILTNPIDSLKTIGQGISSLFSPLLNGLPDLTDIFSGAASAFSLAATPMSGLTSAAIGAGGIISNRNVQIDKIEVQTQATDAEGISRAIDSKLTRQLSQAGATYDDGVAY